MFGLIVFLDDVDRRDSRREQAQGRAERIVAEELRGLGWTEADLASQPKGAAGKLVVAARLRQETTMPLKWIAWRVGLGTSKSANRNVHRWMKANPKPGGEARLRPMADNRGSTRNMTHPMG